MAVIKKDPPFNGNGYRLRKHNDTEHGLYRPVPTPGIGAVVFVGIAFAASIAYNVTQVVL